MVINRRELTDAPASAVRRSRRLPAESFRFNAGRHATVKIPILTAAMAVMFAGTVIVGSAMAQSADAASGKSAKPLSAAASDPVTMGWMQGFPPPDDKLISADDPDHFAFPKLRWSICHFPELRQTTAVLSGANGSRKLQRVIDPGLDAVTFTPLQAEDTMTWDEAFNANYTDGIMVLHHGKVVYERYAGCLDERGLHSAMSVSKSLTGLLAETLIVEGELDAEAKVATIIPELKDSAFGDATVREVLDMETALDYSEDYAARTLVSGLTRRSPT